MRGTRNARDSRKANTFCKNIWMQFFFFTLFFFIRLLYLPIEDVLDVAQLCKCIHKCFKIQWSNTEMIQIYDDLHLLTTVPTAVLLEFKVILYKVAQRQNTAQMNSQRGEGEGTLPLFMQYKTDRRYDCFAIQSTMATNIKWTFVDLSFNVFTSDMVVWKQSLYLF